jgi:hypothetical protein
MKWAMIPFILICILGVNGQEKSLKPNPHQDNPQSDKPTPAPSPVKIDVVKQQTPAQQENWAADHPQSYLRRLFSPENIPNIGLFIVGIIGTIVAVYTLRDIQKQTKNTGTIAGAAKENADAIMISERAWITFLLPEQPIVQKTKGGQPDGYSVVGFIKNVGHTPAIVSRKFHFKNIVELNENLELIPPYLQIEEPQTAYQMIPDAVEPATVEISEFEMRNIEKFKIHVLGQIVYKDVFGVSHETRYCFRFYPKPTADRQRGFYPEGPAAYLKVT